MAYKLDDFLTHVAIEHVPTGYRFEQKGGRIIVTLPGNEGDYYAVWIKVNDFSTPEIQMEGTWLTEGALRKAAYAWMKGQGIV